VRIKETIKFVTAEKV